MQLEIYFLKLNHLKSVIEKTRVWHGIGLQEEDEEECYVDLDGNSQG